MPKTKTKTKPNGAKPPAKMTVVTMLLDETSSMGSRKAATISGVNEYLMRLRADPNPCEFTLLTFSSQHHTGEKIRRKHVAEPLANVKDLTDASYQPEGGTPLIEAATVTINAVDAALAQRDDEPTVIVVIQTDGEENSSDAEYSWPGLRALVAEKEAAGWQFLFIGAGINAYHQGAMMGVSVANTMSYGDKPHETREAFASTAMNMNSVRSGLSASVGYSSFQKASSGDRYDPLGGLPAQTPSRPLVPAAAPLWPGAPAAGHPVATPRRLIPAFHARPPSTPVLDLSGVGVAGGSSSPAAPLDLSKR